MEMIIETTTGRLYRVREPTISGLQHCWYGQPMKRMKDGTIVPKATTREILFEKSAMRTIIEH
jgi:hypothetical protein